MYLNLNFYSEGFPTDNKHEQICHMEDEYSVVLPIKFIDFFCQILNNLNNSF